MSIVHRGREGVAVFFRYTFSWRRELVVARVVEGLAMKVILGNIEAPSVFRVMKGWERHGEDGDGEEESGFSGC